MSVTPMPIRRATRAQRRSTSTDDFLDALEEIVRRYRAGDDSRFDRDADLITAEVARQLAKARAALHP